jgi:hypothetical protein
MSVRRVLPRLGVLSLLSPVSGLDSGQVLPQECLRGAEEKACETFFNDGDSVYGAHHQAHADTRPGSLSIGTNIR